MRSEPDLQPHLLLEKTLLLSEKAKLREWKAQEEAADQFTHTRVVHDDVVISVDWESRQDRRLTPLHCSVSADIRSGYVFPIDVNFDSGSIRPRSSNGSISTGADSQ